VYLHISRKYYPSMVKLLINNGLQYIIS